MRGFVVLALSLLVSIQAIQSIAILKIWHDLQGKSLVLRQVELLPDRTPALVGRFERVFILPQKPEGGIPNELKSRHPQS